MAGKPSEPSPLRRPQNGGGGEQAARVHACERCGPVVIRRLSKDDGRRLILYSRAEDPE
jgi:hypothetical protein